VNTGVREAKQNKICCAWQHIALKLANIKGQVHCDLILILDSESSVTHKVTLEEKAK
jgi:hypothetical protein